MEESHKVGDESLDRIDLEKRLAGRTAASYIQSGMVLGLGTGSTSYHAILRAGELVAEGYDLTAVATSKETARLAIDVGIRVVDIDEVDHIDLAIDGVDEIDPQFNAIKGGGGALYREKVVAMLANEVIWIMDKSKEVEQLGAYPLPVEVMVYGHSHVFRQLKELGYNPSIRMKNNEAYLTDNGNYILDCKLDLGFDIDEVKHTLDTMTGVMEHGLFPNMCKRIVVGLGDVEVKVLENPNK